MGGGGAGGGGGGTYWLDNERQEVPTQGEVQKVVSMPVTNLSLPPPSVLFPLDGPESQEPVHCGSGPGGTGQHMLRR